MTRCQWGAEHPARPAGEPCPAGGGLGTTDCQPSKSVPRGCTHHNRLTCGECWWRNGYPAEGLPQNLDDTIVTLRAHLASSRARVDGLLATQAKLAAHAEAALQELTNRFIDLRSFTGGDTKDDRARAAVAAYKMEHALDAIEDLVREACRG